MADRAVVDWLLEDDQPSIRYRTLVELEGRRPQEPELRKLRRSIPRRGWVAEILSTRRRGGWWCSRDSLYRPKYVATNWQMLVLSDLGVDRSVPAVRTSAELWMRTFAARGGGLGGNSLGRAHHCIAGNMARALIHLGYADDRRVARTIDWLVESADPKGGWSCFGNGRNLDSWEGLSALAVYRRSRWSPRLRQCVERGAEFFLERQLSRQGGRYAPWFRTHYPVHYYYDLLVGLEILTTLGYADDRRLRPAADWLRRRRRPDGRWNLDAVHPDVEGPIARWFASHPGQRPQPLALETVGQASKMITLRSLLVLARLDGVVSRGGG